MSRIGVTAPGVAVGAGVAVGVADGVGETVGVGVTAPPELCGVTAVVLEKSVALSFVSTKSVRTSELGVVLLPFTAAAAVSNVTPPP
jgi:hypothetical protein